MSAKKSVKYLRNRLAHAYGEVDREIVWSVIENGFNEIPAGCKTYCEDMGVEIG